MKGGESIFDMIQALHMDKFLPGAAEALTPHEVDDRCYDLIERVDKWTASAPGCVRYDALVLALAEQTLTDHGYLYHTPCDPPGPCVLCGHDDADDDEERPHVVTGRGRAVSLPHRVADVSTILSIPAFVDRSRR